MPSNNPFWRRVADVQSSALAAGALQPISTTSTIIEDGGVRFLTSVVENLERKRLDAVRKPSDFDPFAHPEEELFVGDISETHFALLNKFNVVNHHVILVTREFEDQESLLTGEDFEAASYPLAERDALVFYNSGPTAGASQRHKHLQVVPVPLGEGPERAPIEALLEDSRELPFAHALCRIDDLAMARDRYLDALASIGTPRAYNLLATRDWMLLVPRTRESWEGIAVNALGFAGALLVRSENELSKLRRLGPMGLLREVTRDV